VGSIDIKPRINKSNGQVSINLRKKDMPQIMKDDLHKIKNIRIKIEGWN